jgi:hypothetical protein
MGPKVFTNDGFCQAYFKGTAIKTSTSREIPSKKAYSRSLPMEVVKNFFILNMF